MLELRAAAASPLNRLRAAGATGLILTTTGIGLVSVPAALIVAGLALTAAAAAVAFLAGAGR